jgi:hypothetical protein
MDTRAARRPRDAAGLARPAGGLLRLPAMFAQITLITVSVLAVQAGLSSQTTAVTEFIAYRFENEIFVEPKIELTLDASGSGRLVFSRKGVARPIERDVRVREEVMAEINDLLDRLDFVRSTESYQTKEGHTNLGTKTVAVSKAGLKREVQFNYTSNRDMAELERVLKGLATREKYAFDLENSVQYEPLAIPQILQSLKGEISLKRVTDPAALVPLLRRIAEDPALPLIAQNRAADLANQIEKGKR